MTVANAEQFVRAAAAHHAAGRYLEALQGCEQALSIDPQNLNALHLKGLLLTKTGRAREAVALLSRVAEAAPGAALVQNNLANALRLIGHFDEATAAYRRALTIQPSLARAHLGLGQSLHALGQSDLAVNAFRAAVQQDPRLAEAWTGLGIALATAGKPTEALEAMQRVAALAPHAAEAHYNLGTAYLSVHRFDDAEQSFRSSIQLAPQHAPSYQNLASVYCESGRVDEAIALQHQAAKLAPNDPAIGAAVLMSLHYSPKLSPQHVLDAHVSWGRRFARPNSPSIPHGNDRSPDRILRIGYLSPDYRAHAVASFLENILIAHDRPAVRVYAYSNAAKFDHVSARLKGEVDEWRTVSALDDAAAAKLILEDKIDILVDLAGHTSGGRPTLMARGAAPVQFTYLGYPATTGVPAIQYRLTDAIADPPGMTESHFTETLVRLPDCFLCYRPDADTPPTHPRTPAADAGFITFGSFNGFVKVTDEMMSLWAEIMNRVPRSRLLIKSRGLNSPSVQQRILATFARSGVAGERIHVMGWTPSDQRHAVVASADIALDTFPYNGTTTTCETLWMGVPWITLAGKTHVSRVSASILTAVGCPELIADQTGDYVEQAVALANDLSRLTSYRTRLRAQMQASPLMDRDRFARNLENAYCAAWKTWCAGGL